MKIRNLLLCLAVGGALVAGCSGPAPRQVSLQTYVNPVFSGSMPDPSVVQYGHTYYAFGTTGADRTSDGRIFTLLASQDLVNWKPMGGALTPPDPNPKYQYWAPEAAYHNGKYYLYYAMGGIEQEKFELRVAISEKPEGPYQDTGTPLVDCENNRFTIDAFPFRDDDGQWYLFYARNFTNSEPGIHPGTALVVDRLIDMTRLAGDCQVVVRAQHDWTLYQANRKMDIYTNTFDWHTIEGPVVLKRSGKYYVFYSGSNYQTPNYGVDYVVANKVTGPYSPGADRPRFLKGVPGKVRGPGHHSIVWGPNGGEWVVYHAWDSAMKVRQMCIDPMVWTPEGPRCVGPTWTPQPNP